MGWRAWNKMIVISSSMAAAGILVCIVALLNALVPKGSILGYAGWTVALAGAVLLVVSGYVRVCDKCEDYLSGRLDRLLAKGSRRPPMVEGSEKEMPAAVDANHCVAQPRPAVLAPSGNGRTEGPRRETANSTRAVFPTKQWRGQ